MVTLLYKSKIPSFFPRRLNIRSLIFVVVWIAKFKREMKEKEYKLVYINLNDKYFD